MKNKKIVIIFCMLLLFSISVFGIQDEINFSETFGTGEYNIYQNGTECLNVYRQDNKYFKYVTIENLTSTTEMVADNSFYCSMSTYYSWSPPNSAINITEFYSEVGENLRFVFHASDFNGNSFGSIDFIFNEPMDIIANRTVMKLSFNSTNNVNFVIFRDGFGNDLLGISNGLSSGIANWTQATYYKVPEINTQEHLTINFNTSHENIRIMSFSSFDGSNLKINISLDEIFINFFNGTNTLPEFNISVPNENICINETGQEIFINLTVDVYDSENDEIYYATSINSVNLSIKTDYADFKIFGTQLSCSNPNAVLCVPFSNYDFLDNAVFPNDETCEIENRLWIERYNSSYFGLLYLDTIYNEPNSVLVLSDKCSGEDKTHYHRFEKVLGDFYYESSLYDFENYENFNITFWDYQIENKIYQLNFNVTGSGDFLIYNINSTDNILIYNESITGRYNFTFSFNTLYKDSTGLIIGLKFGDSQEWITTPDIINFESSVSVVGTTINKGAIYEEYKEFRGVFLTPGFSTTLNSQFAIFDYGTNFYSVYVSDSEHQPEEYEFEIFQVNVVDCKTFIEGINIKEIYPTTRFSFLNDLIYALRQPYLVALQFGILDTIYFGVKVGLVLLMWGLYKKQTIEDLAKDSKDVIRTIFQYMFWIVALIYIMLLIEKSWFVTFSVLGALYYAYEISNISGGEPSESEQTILYTIALFSLLMFVWFSLFQFASGISFGIPEIPEISFSLDYVFNIFTYIKQLLFFSIPEIPTFLNFIVILLRVSGIISFVGYIISKLPLT